MGTAEPSHHFSMSINPFFTAPVSFVVDIRGVMVEMGKVQSKFGGGGGMVERKHRHTETQSERERKAERHRMREKDYSRGEEERLK